MILPALVIGMIVSGLWLLASILAAPAGWEDAAGFHFSRPADEPARPQYAGCLPKTGRTAGPAGRDSSS